MADRGTVLVTGGAGYIGAHACKALSEAGYRPVVYDNFVHGHREAVRWGPLEEGDTADRTRLDEVFAAHRPAAVMHFAAFTAVGESVADPGKYYRNNVANTLGLLEAMVAHGVDRFVFSSTAATYGLPANIPITEDEPNLPINPYGRFKLMVEQMLADFAAAHGLKSAIMRYFNAPCASPEGEIGESHDPETHLIPLALDAAAGPGAGPDPVWRGLSDPDGTCTRYYIHVGDLADAHVLALDRLGASEGTRIFNLDIGPGVSVREILDAVERVTGKPVPHRVGPRAVRAIRRCWSPTPREPAASSAGRRASTTSTPSSARRGIGISGSVVTDPRVSVLITCFNLERFIGAAIESVLAQDLGEPFEIIVVDDCSTDDSAQVIQSFPQVRHLRTERNSGVLLATLHAIEHSCGELLFFLDGDDLWEPDKLTLCVAAFETNPRVSLVTHDLAFADLHGAPIDRPTRPAVVLAGLDDSDRSEKIIEGLCRQQDYIWLGSAWGVRRSLALLEEFADWARRLPDPENTYQDWPLAFWIASTPGAQAAYVPRKLFRYRLHQANHSGDARTREKAARNFYRAANTVQAMHDLALSRGLAPATVNALQRRVRSYVYLVSLSRGQRLRALFRFPAALAHFVETGQFAKELLRLTGIQLLGPGLFARLARLRSGHS